MKREINTKLIIFSILAATCFFACKKDAQTANVNVPHNGFANDNSFTPINQSNLVASGLGMGALIIDPNLVNPIGLAASLISPAVSIADNRTDRSTTYDRRTGLTLMPPITNLGKSNNPAAPTGVVFNTTADFGSYKFIFANQDGTISASIGLAATEVIDRSASNAEYTGLAIAFNSLDNNNYLYACNFNAGTIDVFDKNFNYVPGMPIVTDPNIPAGYAPYNIVNIGGDLYVTYAQQDPPNGLFARAKGGLVDVLDNHGEFLRRFASNGDLNAPWGIALAPAGFADNAEVLLVANNGTGRIDMYNLNGTYLGQLLDHSSHLTIPGVWGIDFFKGNKHGGGAPTDSLYFTAGPNVPARNQGLFGFLANH